MQPFANPLQRTGPYRCRPATRLKLDSMDSKVTGQSLRLSRYHIIVWVSFWMISAAIAERGCATYNSLAGTAKTQQHIAAIAVGVVIGPKIGPFASSGTFEGGPSGVMIYTVLFLGLFASLSPFVFVKMRVSRIVHFLAWCGYIAACVAWFGSAIISIGHFLS